MRNDAVLQFKRRIGSILRRTGVWLAFFIPPPREMRGSDTGDTFDRGEEVVQNVSPVAKHIKNNAAPIFGPVVPRWTLRWNSIALENPIAELAAHGDNPPKKSASIKRFSF